MNEVTPPAPPAFPHTVIPVSETPEQPSSDRQPPHEGSQPAAPAEPASTSKGSGHTEPAVQVSDSVARLRSGARFEVVATGAELEGRPVVRADIGQFTVDAGLSLERSVRYLIEIVSTSTAIRATVIAQNGVAVTTGQELQLVPLQGQALASPTTYRPAPGQLLIARGLRLVAPVRRRRPEPARQTPEVYLAPLTTDGPRPVLRSIRLWEKPGSQIF